MLYVAPVSGAGSDEDPRRPDVPPGVTWEAVADRGDVMVIDSPDLLDLPQEDLS